MSDYTPRGKSVIIDLFECNHDTLVSAASIQKYISDIISLIHMVAHGPCYIERFGSGALEGYSAMQFIETSSITIHCDEIVNRVFIDIFSCKDFDEKTAAEFSKNYFGAQRVRSIAQSR